MEKDNDKQPVYSLALCDEQTNGKYTIIPLAKVFKDSSNQCGITKITGFTSQFNNASELYAYLQSKQILTTPISSGVPSFVLLDEFANEKPLTYKNKKEYNNLGLACRVKESGSYIIIYFYSDGSSIQLTAPLAGGDAYPTVASLGTLAKFTRGFNNRQELLLKLNELGYFSDTPMRDIDDIVFLDQRGSEIDFAVPYKNSPYSEPRTPRKRGGRHAGRGDAGKGWID